MTWSTIPSEDRATVLAAVTRPVVRATISAGIEEIKAWAALHGHPWTRFTAETVTDLYIAARYEAADHEGATR